MKFFNVCLVLFFSMSATVYAQDLSLIAVGDARVENEKILIAPTLTSVVNEVNRKKLADTAKIIANDFSFYKKKYDVLGETTIPNTPNFSNYVDKGISLIIQFRGKEEGTNLTVEAEVYSVSTKQSRFKVEEVVSGTNIRESAHMLANKVYKELNGVDSIFNSKIVFVSDRTGTKRNPIKELYIMDFDGHNKIQLTTHKGTVISPAISHDGKRVLYSLISEGRNRNINLYMMDIETRKVDLLSDRVGMNSGAVFMPSGDSIMLTLSHTGNAELFVMDIGTKTLRRLTQHGASDVDPSISRDGALMTFLSDRPGRANIYTADPTGTEKGVKRISYVGQFNASPRFSPDGKEIVFSSWLDNRFDIFRIGANGENLSRLTKDFGSNESPSYSNDGQFIVFSSLRVISQREASQNIYIMDKDGEIIGSITDNFGSCLSPRWSKY